MRNTERWTARDFLRAASEFERMTSDRDTWTEEHLESNPPRLVRLRRLRALAKAFDVQPGFEALWSGAFVRQRPFEHYQPFVQRVMRESETLFPDALRSMHRPLMTWDVEHVYERLFKFLTEHAYPMLEFNSGVMAASGVYLYLVRRVSHSLAGLPELIRPIEELAGLIIDPASRSFSPEELAPYGWPPEDLFSIDDDYY
jgi:hypothetical protein